MHKKNYLYDSNLTNCGYFQTNVAGTTSTLGKTVLTIGNYTASGTAGNSKGYLNICDETAYNITLHTKGPFTSSHSVLIPDAGGVMGVINYGTTIPTSVSNCSLYLVYE